MFKRNLGERGIAHLAIIAIVALLAVGGAGFYVYQKQQAPTNKAVAEAFKKLDCKIDDKDICKFYTSFNAVKDFTVVLDLGEGVTGNGTYQKSGDNYKLSGEANGEQVDMITIGSTSYVKDTTDGKWWILPSSSDANGSTESVFNEMTFDDPASSKSTYKKLGKEKCGSLTCFKYNVTDEDKSVTTVWFDTRNYQLQKLQTTSDGQVMTATFSFNSPEIKKPSPTKEYPTYSSDLSDYSEEELQQLLEQYGQQ